MADYLESERRSDQRPRPDLPRPSLQDSAIAREVIIEFLGMKNNYPFDPIIFKQKINSLLDDYLYLYYIKDRVYHVTLGFGPTYTLFFTENINFSTFWDRIILLSTKLRHFYLEGSSSNLDKISNYINKNLSIDKESVRKGLKELSQKKKYFNANRISSLDFNKSTSSNITIRAYCGITYKETLENYFNGEIFHCNNDEEWSFLKKELEIAGDDYKYFSVLQFFHVLCDYTNLVMLHYSFLKDHKCFE